MHDDSEKKLMAFWVKQSLAVSNNYRPWAILQGNSMNWKDRERKIFKIELGGAERRFDPLQIVKQYNLAMREMGGPDVVQQVVKDYFGRARRLAEKDERTPEQMAEDNLKDSEQSEFLGTLGAKTLGLPMFKDGAEDGLTIDEGMECLSQFWKFMEKKDDGAGNSPTPVQQDTPSTTNVGDSVTGDGSLSPSPVTS